jgi:predicted glycoside hydrolase/deacetylase ChbG (UPF0249 family)
MLIVNADDFGRSEAETEVALACLKAGRITSATGMVFMKDSIRAAELAQEQKLDVGLHLNLTQRFTGDVNPSLRASHDRVVRFLTSSRYARLLYHPGLRSQFEYVYQAQLDEFIRLYKRHPSHIDGHQHQHLCTNMLVDRIIPAREKVRRSFSFWPGEKGRLNRGYRALIDRSLSRRYRVTDFFFSLEQCLNGNRLNRVFDLSSRCVVELMTHPANPLEMNYLMSDSYGRALTRLQIGSYASL